MSHIASRSRRRTTKAKFGEIEAANESINDANQRVPADIVINTGRKQARLLSVMSFDKAAHWPALGSIVATGLSYSAT